jgi:hypothetical protein
MDPAIFSPQAPGRLVGIYDGNQAFVPTPPPPRLEFTHELAVDELFINPYVTTSRVAERLDVTAPTARAAIHDLVEQGMLTEISGRKWGQLFLAGEILIAVRGDTDEFDDGSQQLSLDADAV